MTYILRITDDDFLQKNKDLGLLGSSGVVVDVKPYEPTIKPTEYAYPKHIYTDNGRAYMPQSGSNED